MGKIDYFLEKLKSSNGGGIEYWMQLEKELDEFVKNEATKEDIKLLYQDNWGATEHLFMICSGVRWEKAQKLIQQYHEEGRSAELEAEIRRFWNEDAAGSEKEEMRKSLPADLLV